jgi:hypothetical protein
MNIIDILAQSGQLGSIGQQFGLNDAQTRAAVEALGPVIGAGISRKAESGGGLADLIGGMARSEQSGIGVDDLTGTGNDILGQIFGSKDVSRGVAQQASGMSGIGAGLLKKMLPVIASMVMAALAKKMFSGGGGATRGGAGGGGLGDILGSILGGGQQQPQAQPGGGGGGLGDILGDILGGGGQRQPQQPGGGGLGDILGDILGGGGAQQRAPQGQQGGLEDMLKDILGGGGGGRLDPAQQEETVRRSRESIDDMLGRRQSTGNPADDLLSSVEDAIRRRR